MSQASQSSQWVTTHSDEVLNLAHAEKLEVKRLPKAQYPSNPYGLVARLASSGAVVIGSYPTKADAKEGRRKLMEHFGIAPHGVPQPTVRPRNDAAK